ncbi:MAG: CCA tRNA nucleotidyltransferase [Granulicella sp.]
MADYIYLLENRLSAGQQNALKQVREVARSQGLTVFLVGGAVRDLTSGSPVRDLDVVVQGNALKLKKQIELAGGVITGENLTGQSFFARFKGGVRIEIGSTLSATFPKPGKPILKAATILDDLRRRDFTVNAMALSLNEGSYGLLMDPLNGVADIENRQLRLVSNYGFIEAPARMIRAIRFSARLGWVMDEKTQARYDTGKQENYIAALSDFHRGYETEEIFHEEDPLRILRKLEEEGWTKHLFPPLTVAKANATELEKLRDIQTQLQMRGIQPEAAAANFPLLTAKLSAKEVLELKKSFTRPGFVTEIETLEADAKEFATLLTGKGAAAPSQAWKLIEAAKPEAVLWVAYSLKSSAIQTKLKSFETEWPQARTRIPYTLMQEMRITPELPEYDELVEKLFFELMDGKLGTVEEMKAFLESYSPPAPPPTVHLRRARAAKKETKSRKKAVPTEDADGELSDEAAPGSEEDGKEATSADGRPVAAKPLPAKAASAGKTPPAKGSGVKTTAAAAGKSPGKGTAVTVPAAKSAPVKGGAKVAAKAPAKAAPKSPAKAAPAKSVPVKKVVVAAKKPAVPAKKVAVKVPAKSAQKHAAKPAPKKAVPANKHTAQVKHTTPVKKVVAKAPVKKIPAKKAAVKAPVKPVPAKKAVPAKKVVPVKKAAPKKKH